LSDITVFSNRDGKYYVRQKELDHLEKKQNKAAKSDTEAELTEREKAIVELLETDEMINLRQVTRTQVQRVSQTLKEENENLQICHVLDRQFDGLPYFQFIEDDLDDSFVIRMKISRKGKAIFLQPMLLITNYTITNYQQAVGVYRIYLQRAKIEGVFKFVKNALGWEDFQVRDWESIKNIIALAFFIGGYFYEIEPKLAHNPGMEWLCALGGGKGTISRHYFLEGLKNLLIHQQVERFREKTRLKPTDWTDVLEFAL